MRLEKGDRNETRNVAKNLVVKSLTYQSVPLGWYPVGKEGLRLQMFCKWGGCGQIHV